MTDTPDGHRLGQILCEGVNSSGDWGLGGGIDLLQEGAAGSSRIPGTIRLFTYTNSTANVDQLILSTNGNIGIGTASPNFKLDVRGTIGNNTTTYHSDIRWKKDIKTLDRPL